MYITRTRLGEVETQCIRLCEKPATFWSTLEKVGTIATGITAIGVIWALWRRSR